MKPVSMAVTIGAVVVALVVGYFIGSNMAQAPSVEQMTETVTAPNVSDTIPFKFVALGEQSESGQVGAATLREEDGKVKVSINLIGEPDTAVQPAHIHDGSCPTPGAIAYPLTNVVDGESETILDTTMAEINAKGPLAINIHKSAAELSTYVNCGNLPD